MTREEKNEFFKKVGKVVPTVTFNIHKIDIECCNSIYKHTTGVLITSTYECDFHEVVKDYLKKVHCDFDKITIHGPSVNPFINKEDENKIILRRAYTLPEMYRAIGDIMSKFDVIPDFILVNNVDFMGMSEIQLINFKSMSVKTIKNEGGN